MHELLAPLNEQQRKAVQTTEGPVLILAGAGSGKTKTLIHRIAYLIAIQKAQPSNILAVTFTNKAASEMKLRLTRLLGGRLAHGPMMGTFHSVCARILRQEIPVLGYDPRFVIYDEADSLNLIKNVMKDLRLDTKTISPLSIAYLISKAKTNLHDPNEYALQATDSLERAAASVYEQYQTELQRNSALDFDDLIRLTVKIFQAHTAVLKKYASVFHYIFVDEYQDTNHAQYILVKLLAQRHKNLCVVGDDYQSIYSWRWADLQNILDFEDDYPAATVVLLEQNYRSTKTIMAAANKIIKQNVRQKEKTLWTENEQGSKIVVKTVADEQEEGEYIIREIFSQKEEGGVEYADEEYLEDESEEKSTPLLHRILRSQRFKKQREDQRLIDDVRKKLPNTDLSQYVILYRTNAQSRALEEAFLKYRVPYRIVGGLKFYRRKEIKDLIAYLRVLVNPNDWVSMERIINVPARGLGEKTWQNIEHTCRDRQRNVLDIAQNELPTMRPLQKGAFTHFQTTMKKLHTALPNVSPSELLDLIIAQTNFKDQFNAKLPEDQSRLENIDELKTVTKGFDHLQGSDGLLAFLEEVTLVSEQDDLDESANAVNMMTIHAAKGLEFDTVFICGMEEGLFPHARSLFQPPEMEEERRLCYVALTRAKRRAYFIYAEQRTVFGRTQLTAPSRFLNDIPEELLDRK